MIQLKFDEIVLGYSLKAILFAYKMGLPIILTKEDYRPIFFKRLPKDFDYEFWNIKKEIVDISTPNGNKKLYPSLEEFYNKIIFILSMAGGVPASRDAVNIKLFENQVLINAKNRINYHIQFEKCHLFETGNISTDLKINIKNTSFDVYDFYLPNPRTSSTYDFVPLFHVSEYGTTPHKSVWFLNPYNFQMSPHDFTMLVHSVYNSKDEIDYPKIIELVIRDYLDNIDSFYNKNVTLNHDYRIIENNVKFDIIESKTVIQNKMSLKDILKMDLESFKYHSILEKL